MRERSFLYHKKAEINKERRCWGQELVLRRLVYVVSNNEYLPVEERGNIINSGTAKLHKLQPEKQPDT